MVATWRTADALCRSAVDELLDSWDEPFEGRIARDTAAAIDGGTLVAASSMPIRDLAAFATPRDDLRVLANRGASGIDGFVATVAGRRGHRGGATVSALCGDLSFLYDLGTLAWSGRRDDLNATFVVPNNDGGAIFSLLEQAALPEFERLFATPHGLDLGAICAAVGVHHERVDTARELAPALDRSNATGVNVVETVVDRSEVGTPARARSRRRSDNDFDLRDRRRPFASRSTPAQRVEQCAELALGLVQFAGGLGSRDDPRAGEQPGGRPSQLRAPERDRPLTVAVRVHPSDASGVDPAIEDLEIGDRLERGGSRRSPDRGGRMQRRDHGKNPGDALAQPTRDRGRQMPHVRGAQELGLLRNVQLIAQPRQS